MSRSLGQEACSTDRPIGTAPIGVALLGCGTVGRQVLRLLTEQSAELAARVGAPVRLAGVAVR
ncbi:MAG: homoserine dehydrogenase, partial [Pseudonocardiaceae bacterium]